jgi:hypothetical protein
VVPERHHVGPGAEELVGELRRDARAVGDILPVDDAQVRAELRTQRVQAFLERSPSGDAEDVREEEESQFRTSDAAGRSSIDTWLPESFV